MTSPTVLPGLRGAAAALLLAVLAVLFLAPAHASAHAFVTGTSPAAGEALDTPPDAVSVTFNEPVQTTPNAVRVFDADGVRIDTGPVEAGEARQVAVGLPDDLPDGAYVAAYRVVSVDSHPVAGTLTFTVGVASALDDAAVAAIAGVDAGPFGVIGSVLRGLGYLGTLLAAGAVAFVAFVARGAADRRRAARLVRLAAGGAITATVLHLPVQGAAVSGFTLLGAVTDVEVVGWTLASGFGQSAALRLVALVALLVLWSRQGPVAGRWLASAAALGGYLLDGHQRSVEPTWLLQVGDAVHLAGAALWAAGLVLLAATLRAARVADDPVGGASVVVRFSRVALWSVVVLSVAGTTMSLPLVRSLGALTSTTYGWLLVAKVAVVAVVLAVAAYNRQLLVPTIRAAAAAPAGGSLDVTADDVASRAGATGAAWARLTTTVRIEAALLAVVVGLTGFLVSTQPAAEAVGLTGPAVATAPLTVDLDVDLVIDPATTGLNAVHVFVVEPSGQPSDQVDDLRLEFTYLPEGIGPITIEPFAAGPGHWTANIEDLRFAGEWEVRVVGGHGRFDEVEATLPFTIGR